MEFWLLRTLKITSGLHFSSSKFHFFHQILPEGTKNYDFYSSIPTKNPTTIDYIKRLNEDKRVKLSQHVSLKFEWLFSCSKAHCKSHALAPLGKQCLTKQCVTNGPTLMLEGIHLPIQGTFVVKKIKLISQWVLKEIFPLCSSRDCNTLLTLLRFTIPNWALLPGSMCYI